MGPLGVLFTASSTIIRVDATYSVIIWTNNIRFQGRDPGTDFRGNGILGLTNLVDFATRYAPLARAICAASQDGGNTWLGHSACIAICQADLLIVVIL